MIGTILKKLLLKLMTEQFLKQVIVLGLERLAKKTDNTIDDEIVAAVKEAVK